jgi:integrase
MKIRRSAYYLEDCREFYVGDPKSSKGFREIYLTDEAIRILMDEKKKKKALSSFDSDFIFLDRDGKPVKRTTYNSQLKRIARKLSMEPFSIHKLRHTFATRCIESGMKPKTLQKIMGHSDITVTLNYYVHVSDNEMAGEMERFSEMAL